MRFRACAIACRLQLLNLTPKMKCLDSTRSVFCLKDWSQPQIGVRNGSTVHTEQRETIQVLRSLYKAYRDTDGLLIQAATAKMIIRNKQTGGTNLGPSTYREEFIVDTFHFMYVYSGGGTR
jgi:hypothetical protein